MRMLRDIPGVWAKSRFPDIRLICHFNHIEQMDQRVIERVSRGTSSLSYAWAS